MLQEITHGIAMRMSLLRNGNSHGVSSNWLSKKLDKIYESNNSLVQSDMNLWSMKAENFHEGELVYNQMIRRYSDRIYGSNYDCESGLASFLHAYILLLKPKVIIETGVANGITTNVIMSALEITGGELHSFDIDKKCENAYTGPGRWFFHHLLKPYSNSLNKEVKEIQGVELWIHDSNHGYSWQRFEYALAYEKLLKRGLLVSDDIDASPAFGIAAEKNWAKSVGIFDKRKFFGFCQKGD